MRQMINTTKALVPAIFSRLTPPARAKTSSSVNARLMAILKNKKSVDPDQLATLSPHLKQLKTPNDHVSLNISELDHTQQKLLIHIMANMVCTQKKRLTLEFESSKQYTIGPTKAILELPQVHNLVRAYPRSTLEKCIVKGWEMEQALQSRTDLNYFSG